MCKSNLISAAVVACALTFGCCATLAGEQTRKIEIVSGSVVRLNVHAATTRDCKPAALPEVRLIDPPSYGAIQVRRAMLTTSQVQGCPSLRVPAQVVFYVARPDYTGTDHLTYEVRTVSGETQIFEFDITVRLQRGALAN